MLEIVRAELPAHYGHFEIRVARDPETHEEAVILSKGRIGDGPLLLRIHSQCLTGDVFGSERCDCGPQLHQALHRIESSANGGAVIYLFQEGRGIGIFDKIRAYALQDAGADTVDANVRLGLPIDGRRYDLALKILDYFHVTAVRLITNNPEKIAALRQHGITIVERVPSLTPVSSHSQHYLRTKRVRMGHLI
jgi:GTP cyclohydrolase II